jgi:hypothetical protein
MVGASPELLVDLAATVSRPLAGTVAIGDPTPTSCGRHQERGAPAVVDAPSALEPHCVRLTPPEPEVDTFADVAHSRRPSTVTSARRTLELVRAAPDAGGRRHADRRGACHRTARTAGTRRYAGPVGWVTPAATAMGAGAARGGGRGDALFTRCRHRRRLRSDAEWLETEVFSSRWSPPHPSLAALALGSRHAWQHLLLFSVPSFVEFGTLVVARQHQRAENPSFSVHGVRDRAQTSRWRATFRCGRCGR